MKKKTITMTIAGKEYTAEWQSAYLRRFMKEVAKAEALYKFGGNAQARAYSMMEISISIIEQMLIDAGAKPSDVLNASDEIADQAAQVLRWFDKQSEKINTKYEALLKNEKAETVK